MASPSFPRSWRWHTYLTILFYDILNALLWSWGWHSDLFREGGFGIPIPLYHSRLNYINKAILCYILFYEGGGGIPSLSRTWIWHPTSLSGIIIYSTNIHYYIFCCTILYHLGDGTHSLSRRSIWYPISLYYTILNWHIPYYIVFYCVILGMVHIPLQEGGFGIPSHYNIVAAAAVDREFRCI